MTLTKPNRKQLFTAVVLLVVLLLQTLISTITATKHKHKHIHIPLNHATSYPNFQHLNVKEAIKGISPTIQQEQETTHDHPNSIKVDILHRDHLPSSSPNSPLPFNHTLRFSNRMRRDIIRVAALTRHFTSSSASPYTVSEFGSDVVSGMDQGSGEYLVRIGVGSPARPQYMVIDSGSDVVWVQCQPCSLCYRQSDPVFDPAESASFSGVPCGSDICSRVDNSNCHSGRCRYEVQYSDGSYTKGTLALETLTLGSTEIKNVAIGCGHMNRGMFIGAAGLMGLGGGSMSLVGQLGGQTGGAFSYCLVSRGTGSESTGSLVFGREYLPVGAAWINLVRNPQYPSFYYVGMTGLGVGGVRVPVPESVFLVTESGERGVVMDTGTAVTRLPREAYGALRDAFLGQTEGNLPRAEGVSIFDTCYDLDGFVSVRVPTVSFYFGEGEETALTLPARNFLIPVDDRGTFCFAFAESASGLSIIGNIQQEGIQISIDGASGFVGFGPSVC